LRWGSFVTPTYDLQNMTSTRSRQEQLCLLTYGRLMGAPHFSVQPLSIINGFKYSVTTKLWT